ncbi:hypothetical protein PM082_002265 [Marasmius tenuissimus]|nr:hypothetical protein PM082_002265 [Marasmius tenuissimus]
MVAIGAAIPSKQAALYDTGKRIDMAVSIAIATFNGLLSLLTGGRIWWISREARKDMGRPVHERYKVFVAAILESGSLYPTMLIVSTIIPFLMDPGFHGTIPIDLSAVAVMTSGLAPTLIIVHVAYGKSVETVQLEQMGTIHFASRGTQQRAESNMSALQSTVNVQVRNPNADVESMNNEEEQKRNDNEVALAL